MASIDAGPPFTPDLQRIFRPIAAT
jgi:hypothetical protein